MRQSNFGGVRDARHPTGSLKEKNGRWSPEGLRWSSGTATVMVSQLQCLSFSQPHFPYCDRQVMEELRELTDELYHVLVNTVQSWTPPPF